MAIVILTLKEQPTVPLEAESINPDLFVEHTHDAIRGLPVFLGKRQHCLEDFFEVEGEKGDELELRGDASRVKWIGRGMTRGRITVSGNVGMHLGAYMKGGVIEVNGHASDWVGAEMTGGLVEGPNIKGQVEQSIKEEMASQSAEPADPLTVERLPRNQREQAEQYFNALREGK